MEYLKWVLIYYPFYKLFDYNNTTRGMLSVILLVDEFVHFIGALTITQVFKNYAEPHCKCAIVHYEISVDISCHVIRIIWRLQLFMISGSLKDNLHDSDIQGNLRAWCQHIQVHLSNFATCSYVHVYSVNNVILLSATVYTYRYINFS